MFDVFYSGRPLGLFAHERYAVNLDHAAEQCRTGCFWYLNSNVDYTEFDFNWRPVPWESEYIHVFPSGNNRDGGVYFANASTVDKRQWHYRDNPVVNRVSPQIYYVDHGNEESLDQFIQLQKRYPGIIKTRFIGEYLDIFKRIVNQANTDYVWIVNSICDYSDFDFNWHPDYFQSEMVHCFSGMFHRRGDTFYIHVESFKRQMVELELLDWFNVINYSTDQTIERFPVPAVYYNHDDLISTIKNYEFRSPYAIFTNQNTISGLTGHNVCLWAEKDRVIESYAGSNAICAVPRDIKRYLDTQIYDYPYIESPQSMKNLYIEESLDIVYISNGEPDAELWYDHLCNQLEIEHKGYPSLVYDNRIKRVKNVNGRIAAYKAAAEKSETPWFFAVFAKLEVAEGFNWNWQPDYWQGPKHYIFNARNPVNGLEYGHMGMIAYNRRLVLETEESGIDFTLSKPHEVVPELSGIAHYNQDPWTTWRTAFRETLKLRLFMDKQPTIETEHRLHTWCNKAIGDYAEWSIRGATDAVKYYESVNGEYSQLMLSFEWAWLKQYYDAKY
jgi:hypothetical protein